MTAAVRRFYSKIWNEFGTDPDLQAVPSQDEKHAYAGIHARSDFLSYSHKDWTKTVHLEIKDRISFVGAL